MEFLKYVFQKILDRFDPTKKTIKRIQKLEEQKLEMERFIDKTLVAEIEEAAAKQNLNEFLRKNYKKLKETRTDLLNKYQAELDERIDYFKAML